MTPIRRDNARIATPHEDAIRPRRPRYRPRRGINADHKTGDGPHAPAIQRRRIPFVRPAAGRRITAGSKVRAVSAMASNASARLRMTALPAPRCERDDVEASCPGSVTEPADHADHASRHHPARRHVDLGLLAMIRGFMREVLSIAAWGIAAVVTLYSLFASCCRSRRPISTTTSSPPAWWSAACFSARC